MNELDFKIKRGRTRTPIDYSSHIEKINKLKSLKEKLIYYNENIESLSLSKINGQVYLPPIGSDTYRPELRIYCECPTCNKNYFTSKKDRKLFLELRQKEVDRIFYLTNELNFKDRIIFALDNIKGFRLGISGIWSNYKKEGIDLLMVENLDSLTNEMIIENPSISFTPNDKDEVKIYNQLIIDTTNTEKSSSGIKYEFFNAEIQIKKTKNLLNNAFDPELIIATHRQQIEQYYNYPEGSNTTKKKFATPPNFEIYFKKSTNGETIDLNNSKLKEYDLIVYYQTIEFFNYYKYLRTVKDNNQSNENTDSKKNVLTTSQQVIIMHYIFDHLMVKEVDRTEKARMIEALTGKNYKNIYDALSSPLATKTKNFKINDLQTIRPFFEKLGLTEIVKSINNELEIKVK